MKTRLSLIVLLTIIALTFSSLALAVETGIPVIGKATINKGTVLMIDMMSGGVGTVKAIEDQELYILSKVPAKPGAHLGGYLLDGDGFAHNCPVHGKEVMGPSIIILPAETINDGNATVQLF
jgi:hypothetical protein